MYPTYKQVMALCAGGEYRRIPLCRELFADRFTPVEVMRTLRAASRHCYLLESAENQSTWGRYSFLGYAPHWRSPASPAAFGWFMTRRVKHPEWKPMRQTIPAR